MTYSRTLEIYVPKIAPFWQFDMVRKEADVIEYKNTGNILKNKYWENMRK